MVEETGKKEERRGLAPWEQHSAVISLPRFDYKAPSSLLDHSHSGFLITCTIKREKSATKEAISILEKFIGSFSCDDSKGLDPPSEGIAMKKRKTCHEQDGEKEESRQAATVLDTSENGAILSLVKLTRSGLLLFTFRRNDGLDTIGILSMIFQSLCSGNLKQPLWCHRIFPIQATCCLKEKDLQVTVSRLVCEYLHNKQNKLEGPIKLMETGIAKQHEIHLEPSGKGKSPMLGYNRRGVYETAEMKIQKTTSADARELSLLDRNRCFSVVAGAFHEVAADSIVDLKSPEIAVFIELLPVSGVPNSSPVVAVSVLPCNLFTAKPRLTVKALIADAKTTEGRREEQQPDA